MNQLELFPCNVPGFFTDKQLRLKGNKKVARLALMCSRPGIRWRKRVGRMGDGQMVEAYKKWRKEG